MLIIAMMKQIGYDGQNGTAISHNPGSVTSFGTKKESLEVII